MESRLCHTGVNRGLVLLLFLHPLAAVNLKVRCAKDNKNAEDANTRYGVAVYDAGQQDGHGLPQRADDDKDDGAKFGYSVENE